PKADIQYDYERSGSNAVARGRIILISVNSPGCVSTSIDPPCCLTTMSWQIERPRPVPSPAGLVVKKGLNIGCCPLSGVKRTSLFALHMSAYDAVDGASPAASKCYRLVASKPKRFKEVRPGNRDGV